MLFVRVFVTPYSQTTSPTQIITTKRPNPSQESEWRESEGEDEEEEPEMTFVSPFLYECYAFYFDLSWIYADLCADEEL